MSFDAIVRIVDLRCGQRDRLRGRRGGDIGRRVPLRGTVVCRNTARLPTGHAGREGGARFHHGTAVGSDGRGWKAGTQRNRYLVAERSVLAPVFGAAGQCCEGQQG